MVLEARPESGYSVEIGHPTKEFIVTPNSSKDSIVFVSPRFTTPEGFSQLDGDVQEVILNTLLRTSDVAKLSELRPDFNIYKPLSEREIATSYLVREIVKRDKPITIPTTTAPDSLFTQIHALGYPISKEQLVKTLEHERQRAKFEFPDSKFARDFAPQDPIGDIPAARRYLANLTLQIREDNLSKSGEPDNYSRDYFKPKLPVETDLSRMSGQDKRMLEACNAYEMERGGLVGISYI